MRTRKDGFYYDIKESPIKKTIPFILKEWRFVSYLILLRIGIVSFFISIFTGLVWFTVLTILILVTSMLIGDYIVYHE